MKIKIDDCVLEKIRNNEGIIELFRGSRERKRNIIERQFLIEKEVERKTSMMNRQISLFKEKIEMFEKSTEKASETIEQFREELYKLQEICIIINKIGNYLKTIDDLSIKVDKFQEDMILFKLKLIKEERKEENG